MAANRQKLIEKIQREIKEFPSGPEKIKFVEKCEREISCIKRDCEYEECFEEMTLKFSCCEKNTPFVIHYPPRVNKSKEETDEIKPLYSYEIIFYAKNSSPKNVRFRDSSLIPGLAAVYETQEFELCGCEKRIFNISQATPYPVLGIKTFKSIDCFDKQTDHPDSDSYIIPDGTVFMRCCFNVLDG